MLTSNNNRNDILHYLEKLQAIAVKQNQNNINKLLEEQKNKLQKDLLYLVILGEYKRGKSTFVNALLGTELLPYAVIPLTSLITKITYGLTPEAKAHFKNGATKTIKLDDIGLYVTEKGNPNNQKEADYLEIFYPSPILEKGVVLVDTPGIGSIHEHNTLEAHNFLPRVDAAIIILTVDHPLSKAESDFLNDIQKEVPELFFVLNKTDLVTDQELEESLNFTKEVIFDKHGQVFPIYALSAKQALEAKLDNDSQLLEKSNFTQLESSLDNFILTDKDRVSLLSALIKTALQAKRLLFQIELEKKAISLPIKQLDEKIKRVDSLFAEAKHKVKDIQHIINGEIKELTAAIEEDITAIKHEQIELFNDNTFNDWYPRNSHLDAAELMSNWSAYFYKTLNRVLTEAKKELENRQVKGLEKLFTRFNEQVEATITVVEKEAAEIFDLEIEYSTDFAILPENEAFYFMFGIPGDFIPDKPNFFLRNTENISRFLPKKIAHNLILREMKSIIFNQVDRNCGRLRSDIADRTNKTVNNYKQKISFVLEEVIGSIEAVIDKVCDHKKNKAGDYEKIAADLEAQKNAIQKIIKELENQQEQAGLDESNNSDVEKRKLGS